jgi:carbamoyltransferase
MPGGALGAAILGALELGDRRPAPLASAALGLAIDPGAAHALATELGFAVTRADDIAGDTAELIARGQIVAFCAGRFEWGPRALGQRSILADARDPDSRERLNRSIKRREPFRPFAPAVLATDAARYFFAAPNAMTPFMTTTCPIRDEHAGAMAAVRHVDGSARVQTVTATAAPALHAVLGAFAERTGVPIVLNTSFNGAGEPIIASEVDALAFLLGHPIDALVVEDLLITKAPR